MIGASGGNRTPDSCLGSRHFTSKLRSRAVGKVGRSGFSVNASCCSMWFLSGVNQSHQCYPEKAACDAPRPDVRPLAPPEPNRRSDSPAPLAPEVPAELRGCPDRVLFGSGDRAHGVMSLQGCFSMGTELGIALPAFAQHMGHSPKGIGWLIRGDADRWPRGTACGSRRPAAGRWSRRPCPQRRRRYRRTPRFAARGGGTERRTRHCPG